LYAKDTGGRILPPPPGIEGKEADRLVEVVMNQMAQEDLRRQRAIEDRENRIKAAHSTAVQYHGNRGNATAADQREAIRQILAIVTEDFQLSKKRGIFESRELPKELKSDFVPSEWTARFAPYDFGTTAGVVGNPATASFDINQGTMSTWSKWVNYDASDYDYFGIYCNSCIGFWYTVPANGILEGFIDATPIRSYVNAQYWDEWGVSDSVTRFYNRRTWYFRDTEFYGAGQTLFIGVCNVHNLRTWVNDVSTSQEFWAFWKLNTVWTRIN